jgi:hypothetical protein
MGSKISSDNENIIYNYLSHLRLHILMRNKENNSSLIGTHFFDEAGVPN